VFGQHFDGVAAIAQNARSPSMKVMLLLQDAVFMKAGS